MVEGWNGGSVHYDGHVAYLYQKTAMRYQKMMGRNWWKIDERYG